MMNRFILAPFFFICATIYANEIYSDLQGNFSSTLVSTYIQQNKTQTIQGITPNWEQLNQLYAQREFESIWIDERGIKTIGYLFIHRLKDSWMHGLEPEDYHYTRIQSLTSDHGNSLLDIEILLTDAFIRYYNDVRYGRALLKQIANEWYIQNGNTATIESLAASIPRNELRITFPEQHGYKALQKKLVEFTEIKQNGGLKSLGDGPVLSKGVRHNQVINLRMILTNIGDYTAEMQADPYYFSEALEQAVKRFQKRHHLIEDGVVGKATRQELNVPIEQRIDQIKLALERWRWLPDSLGDKYVWINLASSHLDIIEKGEKVLSMRSIIGRPYRSTPSLNSELSAIVVNPEWVVPRTLAVEDLLPMQQESGDFLQNKNIRVLAGWSGVQTEVKPDDIDWNSLNENYFPYQLRQSPGDHNSLGRYKFLFKNPFEIYLHDTPAKRLFNLEKRTFSSGCIRIEKPDVLAKYLLQNQPLYTSESFSNALESEETRYIRLTQKVPVYIVYMTTWIEDDKIHFQRDFYDRDRPILQAMHPN